MAGLGFERDKTRVLSGDWSDQFFSKGFQVILLGMFPRPAAVETGGLLCTSCTRPLSGLPSPLLEPLFLILPSSSGSSSVMVRLGLAAALWVCRRSSVQALPLFPFEVGCSSLGFTDHSWVEGCPLRVELILTLCTPHSLSQCPLTTSTQRWLKLNVLHDLSQKHFLLLMALLPLIHTLSSITQMPGHPWRVPCPDIPRPVSPFLSPPSLRV